MKKVLIAEDEEMLSLIIKDALEIKGFEVATAGNGEDALTLVKSFEPDLLILDIMMPKISGYEVATTIRKTNQHLPILFLSAKSQTVDVLKGFESGANDYVKKPFSIDELMARIRVLIKNSPLDPEPENRSKKQTAADGYVFMKDGSKLLKVNFEDITYIEAERDYANLFRGEKKTLISSHLKEIESLLPKELFIRVHRSFIVSVKAISAIKGSTLDIGKKEIPIGSNYKDEVYRVLGL
ncbi:MAG: two component transcriptional regulator, winged helix family [Bacteroidetes bacterium]|jgi:DNA-binding response OmpR family regulator|nr:two component transcriptional regulator, winged helix family [Bacteroidota bacterium]